MKIEGQRLAVGRVASGSFGATRKGGQPFTKRTKQPRVPAKASARRQINQPSMTAKSAPSPSRRVE